VRRAALVAAAVLAVLTAAAAFGAFTAGKYGGATVKNGAVSFTASKTAVTNFTVAVPLTCSNGNKARNSTVVNRMPIRNDRFATTGPVEIHGHLNGSTASGTAAVTIARLPNGRNCRSGTVRWTAKRGAVPAGGYQCTVDASFNGGDLQVDAACTADFDAFIVRTPRQALRADTSTANLKCFPGTTAGPSYTGPVVNCSAQDGMRMKSGRVLIRFDSNAACADADAARVTFLRSLEAESDPFKLKTLGC
jgi:hypothetical protein